MAFPHFNEMESLCNALAEGRCGTEDMRRLEELVMTSDAAAQYYVRFFNVHYEIMDVHEESRQQQRLKEKVEQLFADKSALLQSEVGDASVSSENLSPSENALIFPLLGFEKELLDSTITGSASSEPQDPSSGSFFAWTHLTAYVPLAISLITLGLALWIALVLPIYNSQDDSWKMMARMKRTVDCQWKDGKSAYPVGTFLVEGEKIELESGLAEIEFSSGARVVLQGPAQLVISDKNSSQLRYGRLVAHVPP
ncbi:MAG: hypothetical protein PVH19_14125, partial [Planctomycetia bacterium]